MIDTRAAMADEHPMSNLSGEVIDNQTSADGPKPRSLFDRLARREQREQGAGGGGVHEDWAIGIAICWGARSGWSILGAQRTPDATKLSSRDPAPSRLRICHRGRAYCHVDYRRLPGPRMHTV